MSHLIIADILEALEREVAVAVSERRRRAIPPERLAVNFDRVALRILPALEASDAWSECVARSCRRA